MSAPDLAPEQFVRLSKDYAEIEPAAAAAGEVRRLRAELEALSGMADDPEMREMVAEEAEAIRKRLPEAERALALRLLPRDAAAERPAMQIGRASCRGRVGQDG